MIRKEALCVERFSSGWQCYFADFTAIDDCPFGYGRSVYTAAKQLLICLNAEFDDPEDDWRRDEVLSLIEDLSQ